MSRRPLVIALFAVVSALSVAGTAHAAVGDLPRLTSDAPQKLIRDWYDDHSLSGDGHLSWSNQGAGPLFVSSLDGSSSQREPQSIRFSAVMHVGGAGGLELCGYPSGTTGWMRAYQAAPGAVTGASCPGSQPSSGQIGWFRYIYARHSAANEFNRWHFMDLERYALVPLPADQGGPQTATPTVWDNHWGTCLDSLSGGAQCTTNLAATSLDVGEPAGTAKDIQPHEVDSQLIPITATLQPAMPEGLYQVVDLMNPYGLIKEADGHYGNVSCATISVAFTAYTLAITPINLNPATCYVPAQLDPALTGPGGFDPMQGAADVAACTLPYRNAADTSHCWPASDDPADPNGPPHSGPYVAAHTLSTGDPAYIPSTPVAQGSSISAMLAAHSAAPAQSVPAPPAPAPKHTTPTPKLTPKQRRAIDVAKARTRSALRKVFGKGLSRLHVSCRLRKGGASTCTVSWRKSHARYSGHIYLRNHRVNGHLRWQYRVDVTRKKKGHKTTHVRRGYRTGGRVG